MATRYLVAECAVSLARSTRQKSCHNSEACVHSGPYFYLPKMQSHLEARLCNDVFVEAQAELGVPRGSIRVSSHTALLGQAYA